MTARQAKQVAKDRRVARQAKWAERAAEATSTATWRGASHFMRTATANRDTNRAR